MLLLHQSDCNDVVSLKDAGVGNDNQPLGGHDVSTCNGRGRRA